MASNGQKSSRKHGRNFRTRNSEHRATSSTTRYMAGKGPAKHEARSAANCGCGYSVNHTRRNRAQHEAERQMKAAKVRADMARLTEILKAA